MIERSGGRSTLLAVKELGLRGNGDQRTLWGDIPTPFLVELNRLADGGNPVSAFVLVIDGQSRDLIIVPFDDLVRAKDLRDAAGGKSGNFGWNIKPMSLGYALQTPANYDDIRLRDINTLSPVFAPVN